MDEAAKQMLDDMQFLDSDDDSEQDENDQANVKMSENE